MPRVPRYGDRQVGVNPLRGGFKQAAETPLSQGAGVERARAQKNLAIADVGGIAARMGADVYGRILEREREEADQTAMLKANNRLAEWKNKRLYDPQGGAFTVKGEAALPLPESIREEFDQLAGEIESGLTTDRQRQAFANLRSNEWQSVQLQILRHVSGEIQTFKANELKGLVDNTVNSAIASAHDPKLVAVELQKAVSAIQTTAPGLGIGKEEIEAQVRAVQTKTHMGVISQLLAEENDRAASAYFEAVKGQIDATQYDQVTKALEEGQIRGESQRQADGIIRGGGTRTQQREKAKAIEDPKLRDAVLQRIEHEHNIAEREDREREQADMRRGYDILDRTPDVSKIPPDLWTSYDGSTRSAMLSYARTRTKGEPVETNLATYYGLMTMAGEKPEDFANWNLLQYRHQLGESEFKQLVGIQSNMKANNRQAVDKDVAPFLTRKETVDQTLIQHGIDPRPKADTPEAQAIAQLYRMVERRVDILQGGGKKASNADIQAEVDAILSQSITTPGSWWAILRPFTYDVADRSKRIIDVTINDIPAHERRQVEEALRARNRPVNDATIRDLWVEIKLLQQNKK